MGSVECEQAEQALQRSGALDRVRAAVFGMKSTSDIHTVLTAIYRELQALGVGFNDCSINLLKEGTEPPEYACYCICSEGIRVVAARADASAQIREMWRMGEPVYRSDLGREDGYGEKQYIDGIWEKRIRSVVDVPFSKGTLAINSVDADAFSQEDIELLKGFAGVLSEGYTRVEDLERIEESAKAVQESEQRYRDLYEEAPHAYFSVGVDGRIRMANRRAVELLGYAREDLVGHPVLELYADTPGGRGKAREVFARFLAGEEIRGEELEMRRADGQSVWISLTVRPIRDEDGQVVESRSMVVDITQRKQAEEGLRKKNRALTTLGACNRALVHATDESELLHEICQICVEVGGYQMAWVGYAEQDEQKSVRSVAEKGFEEGYLDAVNITWADNERGRGPTGTAIRTGEPCIVRNILEDPNYAPWRAAAIERGYASSIALPLIANDHVLGALNMYATEPDAFDAEEVELLTELSSDLAYGVGSLRTRVERARAEEALRQSRERLEVAEEHAHLGSWELEVGSESGHWSKQMFRLLEFEPQDRAPSFEDYLDRIHPDDRPIIQDVLMQMTEGIEPTLRVFRSNPERGPLRYFSPTYHCVRDRAGKPVKFQGTLLDITERVQAEEALQQSFAELQSALEGTIHALASAAERRDPYTAGHQHGVAGLAGSIAEQMGLPPEQQNGIRMAGMIHDIGKIAIPAEILSKPVRLNDIELSLIKSHSEVGYGILKDIVFPWPIAQMVYQHHERMDGSGYPQGLSGEAILLEARILAVADVVEAMSSHRPYRPALGIDTALQEISQHRGVRYDPRVVDICLKVCIEEGMELGPGV